MPSADQMERDRKRTVGKPATSPPVNKNNNQTSDFALPFADLNDPTKNVGLGAVNPNVKWNDIYNASKGLGGSASDIFYRSLGGLFSGNSATPPTAPTTTNTTGSGSGGNKNNNNALMKALTQYATGIGSSGVNPAINAGYGQLSADAQARAKAQQDMIDQFYGGAETQLGGLNSQALAMLQNMYNQTAGEIGTQAEAGRTTIDESTQRALEALGGQSNPYAGLQMANVGAVTDPMAAYSQAVGAPQGGIQALQDMLQSQNATTSGGFSNLAQLLGASNQAAQQGRIGDVNVARAGAQQDLAANQRAAGLQALQQLNAGQMNQQNQFSQQMLGLGQNRLQAGLQNQSGLGELLNQFGLGQLQANLGQQQNAQGRQDNLMQQLLGLAGQGVDVSQIMALLGGQ
jgi:hypothetical protein